MVMLRRGVGRVQRPGQEQTREAPARRAEPARGAVGDCPGALTGEAGGQLGRVQDLGVALCGIVGDLVEEFGERRAPRLGLRPTNYGLSHTPRPCSER